MNLRTLTLRKPSGAGRVAVFGASVGLMVFLGYIHYFSGLAYDFRALFVLPVLIPSWYLGFRAGLTLALLSAATWMLADWELAGGRVAWFSMIVNTAMRLAVLIGEAWILEQLRRLLDREIRFARQDPLTGLENRRGLLEQGIRALALARRQQTAVTTVFIDLDKFKYVNDQLGHETGDALLKCVAARLRASILTGDIAGRLGGDEFALLLPGMDGAAARIYVQTIRQRLLDAMRENAWPVTFSIGVVSHRQAPQDLDRILVAADRLMYEAKQGGGNRIAGLEF